MAMAIFKSTSICGRRVVALVNTSVADTGRDWSTPRQICATSNARVTSFRRKWHGGQRVVVVSARRRRIGRRRTRRQSWRHAMDTTPIAMEYSSTAISRTKAGIATTLRIVCLGDPCVSAYSLRTCPGAMIAMSSHPWHRTKRIAFAAGCPADLSTPAV